MECITPAEGQERDGAGAGRRRMGRAAWPHHACGGAEGREWAGGGAGMAGRRRTEVPPPAARKNGRSPLRGRREGAAGRLCRLGPAVRKDGRGAGPPAARKRGRVAAAASAASAEASGKGVVRGEECAAGGEETDNSAQYEGVWLGIEGGRA